MIWPICDVSAVKPQPTLAPLSTVNAVNSLRSNQIQAMLTRPRHCTIIGLAVILNSFRSCNTASYSFGDRNIGTASLHIWNTQPTALLRLDIGYKLFNTFFLNVLCLTKSWCIVTYDMSSLEMYLLT